MPLTVWHGNVVATSSLCSTFFPLLLAPFQAGWVCALSYVGFKQAGIAAGSVGASLMSSAALANGGAVAAGSTVAFLQGLGATAIYPSILSTASGLGIYATAGFAFARRFLGN